MEPKAMQRYLGIALFFVVLIAGMMFLEKSETFFRLMVGMAFGYVLARADTGFAGSVNRAYRTGSTHLLRSMMLMFFVAALMFAAVMIFLPEGMEYKLKINPINLGMMTGAFLFGFGMALSSCCGSGVLTDLAVDLPRAFVTFSFFIFGVFVGFPFEHKAAWVKKSWFVTENGGKGVYLPDLFGFDHANGYLGALIFTGLMCLLFAYGAEQWQKRQEAQGYNTAMEEEVLHERINTPGTEESAQYSGFLNKVFIKPWTLYQAAIGLAVVWIILFLGNKSGWGVTTAFGETFGRLLLLAGVPVESLSDFTGIALEKEKFTKGFFENGGIVQNMGIVLGAAIYWLLIGLFSKGFLASIRPIPLKSVLQYATGGFTMGFGTRLAGGCNAGALFTPIAELSLSGWGFLVFMILGAILGNKIYFKSFKNKQDAARRQANTQETS